MKELVLKNCKLVDKDGIYYIGVNNGKIDEISKQPLKADEEININEKIVLPGLIDPHVHFRDPGLTYKENFKSGSYAAAHGGFTCVLDMPNTIPPTNTSKDFKEKKKIGEKKSIIDFGLHSGINNLNDLKNIIKLNPASFKIFMDFYEDFEIEEIFKNISSLYKESGNNKLITLHAEKKGLIEESTNKLKSLTKEERNIPINYSYARNTESEVASVYQGTYLAEKYNVPIHICHLSTKKALQYIKSIPMPKINISTEITPHHLLLDNTAFNKYGSRAKTNPPLRPKEENLTYENLEDIDMIGTDHAPHTIEEKQKGIWNSNPGIPNLETSLPLLLTEVNKGNIDIKKIPKLMSENPAKRFNLINKGKIEIDYDADFCIVDLKKEGKFDIDTFYTKAKYSPFKNWKYKGIATMTISKGRIIMENGIVDTSITDNNNYTNKGKYVYD